MLIPFLPFVLADAAIHSVTQLRVRVDAFLSAQYLNHVGPVVEHGWHSFPD
jgi:hypothetical protein